MSIETEKKYRLRKEDMDQVANELDDLNAEFSGEVFEENRLFGNDLLKAKKAVLRIRTTENESIITYKEFVPNSMGVKQHVEYETKVESAETLEKILNNLGLEKQMIYEKRRRTWKFKQVEVVLDELPFGLFMEIEGSLMGIAEAEMFIGADEFEIEPAAYPYLVKKYGRRIENRIEARFSDPANDANK